MRTVERGTQTVPGLSSRAIPLQILSTGSAPRTCVRYTRQFCSLLCLAVTFNHFGIKVANATNYPW